MVSINKQSILKNLNPHFSCLKIVCTFGVQKAAFMVVKFGLSFDSFICLELYNIYLYNKFSSRNLIRREENDVMV